MNPVFRGGECPLLRGRTLELVDHIANALRAYRTFLMNMLAHGARDATLTSVQGLEQILPGPPLLYVYMPAEAARQCLERGNLDPVPRNLRPRVLLDLVVATTLPPYDTNMSREAVAARYRASGCQSPAAADIDFFIAIPHTTAWAELGNSMYSRASSACDVVLIGPALFREQPRMRIAG
nr:RolB family protein [Bradyrhizobium algeriense]